MRKAKATLTPSLSLKKGEGDAPEPKAFAVNFLMESIEKFLVQERLKSGEEVIPQGDDGSEQLSVMAEAE